MAAEQALANSAPDIAARSLADPLEPELQRLRRGPYLGRLEGFQDAGGLAGWASVWPLGPCSPSPPAGAAHPGGPPQRRRLALLAAG